MLRQLEIDRDFHEQLQTYCNEKSIGFLSSPFDEDGIEMLYQTGMRVFKVPSGEIINLPYLRKLGGLNCEVILSSGMSDLDEIATALNILEESGTGKDKITVLHCNTDYPTRFEDVNLRAMNTIGKELGVRIGYSDHTPGIEVPVAATALGAKVIEKHFTLDRSMKGPDHKASLEPDELGQMVRAIRNIEMALGDGVKKPSGSETKNIPIARKSIHIARNLKKGHHLEPGDLIMLRPGDGISPMEVDQITGRVLNSDLSEGHKLRTEDLE
jgi:N,N'-diacetyllegionaminate synthase